MDPAVVLMADPEVTSIPVEDNGERLVDVRTGGLGFDGTDELSALVRVGVARRLWVADRTLPDGLRILVREAYRTPEAQERAFEGYRQRLITTDRSLDHDASVRLASRFVSPPSLAPHTCGAAVDLTLADDVGQPLDLGTPIDASPEESDGACYFAADNIGGTARANRETLDLALRAAGLVNYPTEWWHWSYGDRYWAMASGRATAIYGPVTGPVNGR